MIFCFGASALPTLRQGFFIRQYRIILSADTASEVRQLLSQKSADNTLCCKGERRRWRIQRTEAGAAVAECEGLLSPKHDAGTATRHYRAFWQCRCRAAHRAAARRFGAQPTLCGGSWRGDPPERCLSRQAGIVRCCHKKRGTARWSLFRTACYYTFFSNPSAVKTAVSPSLISAAAKAASG